MRCSLLSAIGAGGPDFAMLHNRMHHCLVGRHPELTRLNTIYMNLGMPYRESHGIGESTWRALERAWRPCDDMHADWLLGDLVGMTCRDEAGLEALVLRAVEEPKWRESRAAEISGRVRARLTYGALVTGMLEMVRGALNSSVPVASAA